MRGNSTTMNADGARRSDDEQQRVEQAVRHLCEHSITFNRYLGFRVTELGSEQVGIRFDMRPELIGHFQHGRLHGGVTSSVLDATGGLAVIWALTEYHAAENADQVLSRFSALGTIDLRVDYLRQGIGEWFTATAQVVRLGRRIASTRMHLHNDRQVEIATGSATYIVS